MGNEISTTSKKGNTASDKEEFKKLLRGTHFDSEELMLLKEFFQSCSKGDGMISREDFNEGFRAIFDVADPLVMDRMFRCFDENSDGVINFREFVCGLSIYHRGTLEEKLRLSFQLYDTNGDTFVDKEEAFHMLKGMWNLAEVNRDGGYADTKAITEYVDKVFDQLDVNKDGHISFEEYMKVAIAQAPAQNVSDQTEKIMSAHQKETKELEQSLAAERARQKEALKARLEGLRKK